jgi:AraC-like DNA-binding protein
MQIAETIQQFYARVMQLGPGEVELNNAGAGHFNVFSRDSCYGVTPYGRRDFYKITLILGKGRLTYEDAQVEVDRPTLLFSNPMIPYSWASQGKPQKGWYCLFTDAFLQAPERKEMMLHDSPLYQTAGVPVFFVDGAQEAVISHIFQDMLREMESDYAFKFDMMRHYLHLLIHQAMKMRPIQRPEQGSSAALRLSHQFMDLLERQFPIDTTETELQLKTANDFAARLSVHVNHLNRSLKEVTGKTTTEHISARILQEAMALLKHSDWNIAQIAYGLGFEYPAYFNIFFKKHTGHTPMEVRNAVV